MNKRSSQKKSKNKDFKDDQCYLYDYSLSNKRIKNISNLNMNPIITFENNEEDYKIPLTLSNIEEDKDRKHKEFNLSNISALINDEETLPIPNKCVKTIFKDKLMKLLTKFENGEEYIFDSYLLKRALKSYGVKKENMVYYFF